MTLRFIHLTLCISASITLAAQSNSAHTRAWGDIEHHGRAWVTNLSKDNKISKGLQDRHISLWASHGYYYDPQKKKSGNGNAQTYLEQPKTCLHKPL